MNTKPYMFAHSGDRYILSIANREEIVAAIKAFCDDAGILSATVQGIGAVDEATLRFYDPSAKRYVDKTFSEQMEIANLTGNVSENGGVAYLHLHATLGRADCTAIAGHLLSARINGAGEFVVEADDCAVSRRYDPETGLNLYAFPYLSDER